MAALQRGCRRHSARSHPSSRQAVQRRRAAEGQRRQRAARGRLAQALSPSCRSSAGARLHSRHPLLHHRALQLHSSALRAPLQARCPSLQALMSSRVAQRPAAPPVHLLPRLMAPLHCSEGPPWACVTTWSLTCAGLSCPSLAVVAITGLARALRPSCSRRVSAAPMPGSWHVPAVPQQTARRRRVLLVQQQHAAQNAAPACPAQARCSAHAVAVQHRRTCPLALSPKPRHRQGLPRNTSCIATRLQPPLLRRRAPWLARRGLPALLGPLASLRVYAAVRS